MGNAFVAGLKNEAPRGRDVTKEDRNSEVSHRGTQRGDEGSEFSYMTLETKLRLEIGRYDSGSFGSSVRFFSNGRTMVILLRLGSFVWLNDALHMRTIGQGHH